MPTAEAVVLVGHQQAALLDQQRAQHIPGCGKREFPALFAKYELKTKLKLCYCTILIEGFLSNLFALINKYASA